MEENSTVMQMQRTDTRERAGGSGLVGAVQWAVRLRRGWTLVGCTRLLIAKAAAALPPTPCLSLPRAVLADDLWVSRWGHTAATLADSLLALAALRTSRWCDGYAVGAGSGGKCH